MFRRYFKRLIKKWGINERGDESKHIEIPWKQRRIAGFILIALILIKIGLLLLKFLMPNPGFNKIMLEVTHHVPIKKIPKASLPGLIIGFMFVFISYSVGTYAFLDKRHKLTKSFFSNIKIRLWILLIINIISYSLTFYFTFDGYQGFIDTINQKIKSHGGTKHYSLNIDLFIPIIISASITFASLGAFYLTFKVLMIKNKIAINLVN